LKPLLSKDIGRRLPTTTGKAFNIWRDLKPSLQIDVDHDYVEMIEMMFVRLEVYISTHDRSEALASLRLILNTWENIGAI
jgi:hypothetical protein